MKKVGAGDPDLDDSSGRRRRRSRARRLAAIMASVLATIGCCLVAWWMSLASCLPEGVTMTTETRELGDVTVARRLLEVGAYAWRGKIYDRSGREVIFFRKLAADWGANPGLGLQRELRERVDALRVDHTVIEVRHHRTEGEPLRY
jgi:hypothetical protein